MRVEIIGGIIFLVLEWAVCRIYNTNVYNHKESFNIPIKFTKESEIRLSFSYLIRIKFEDKYLLVKGKYGKYQPVGGVYHYNDRFLENNFDFKLDEYHADKNDIRGCIKLKKLDEFIIWFNTCKNREIAPIREFKEELISTNIIQL